MFFEMPVAGLTQGCVSHSRLETDAFDDSAICRKQIKPRLRELSTNGPSARECKRAGNGIVLPADGGSLGSGGGGRIPEGRKAWVGVARGGRR